MGRVSVGVCQREAGSPGAGGVRSGVGGGGEMGVVCEATRKKKPVSGVAGGRYCGQLGSHSWFFFTFSFFLYENIVHF